MSEKICSGLEEIARLVKSTNDTSKINEAIGSLRNLISGREPYRQLETELNTWQVKLSVILKESVGREGMVKHARYWVERIKNAG